MTPPTVQGIPTSAAAGDTWRWNVSAYTAAYPSAEGWTLALTLRGAGAPPAAVTVDRAAGDVVTVPASTTVELLGDYTAAVVATLAGSPAQRFTAVSRQLVVTPDPAGSTALVSHAAKCLALIEAALEGRVVSDAESYAILGRSITKTPIAQLYGMRSRYRLEVQAERNGGRLPPARVRFARA